MKKFLALKKVAGAFILSFLVLSLNSCVYCVIGGLGALGGYVVSPDTVQGTIIDRSYDEIWKASVQVLSDMGMLEQQNETAGILQARFQKVRVQVSVFRVGKNMIKLSVKARQNFFPKVKTAQDVYVKIVSALDADTQEK